MGKKNTNITQIEETVDNSAQNGGVSAVRGDGNVTNVLDADAIASAFSFSDAATKTALNTNSSALKEAFSFANNNNTGLIGLFGDLANKAFDNANKQTNAALNTVSNSTSTLNSAIQTAQTKLQNNGIDPQKLIFGALLLTAFIVFRSSK